MLGVLLAGFKKHLDAKWDKEMDEDIAAGRLDRALGKSFKADIAAGRCKPLDEILNDE